MRSFQSHQLIWKRALVKTTKYRSIMFNDLLRSFDLSTCLDTYLYGCSIEVYCCCPKHYRRWYRAHHHRMESAIKMQTLLIYWRCESRQAPILIWSCLDIFMASSNCFFVEQHRYFCFSLSLFLSHITVRCVIVIIPFSVSLPNSHSLDLVLSLSDALSLSIFAIHSRNTWTHGQYKSIPRRP